MAQLVKNLPKMQETWVQSLDWKDPLEKGKAAHSSILAWRIPWTLQSMGSWRVGYDWATSTFAFLCTHCSFLFPAKMPNSLLYHPSLFLQIEYSLAVCFILFPHLEKAYHSFKGHHTLQSLCAVLFLFLPSRMSIISLETEPHCVPFLCYLAHSTLYFVIWIFVPNLHSRWLVNKYPKASCNFTYWEFNKYLCNRFCFEKVVCSPNCHSMCAYATSCWLVLIRSCVPFSTLSNLDKNYDNSSFLLSAGDMFQDP